MAHVSNPSEAHMTELVRSGNPAALGEVFTHYRDRLLRMVVIRMDRRLQGRIDPSDVLQEAYFDAAGRLDEYVRDTKVPPFLWLRTVVGDRLVKLDRQHFGAQECCSSPQPRSQCHGGLAGRQIVHPVQVGPGRRVEEQIEP